MSKNKRYRLISFPELGDERGNLVVIEKGEYLPFEIRRIFYIYGTKPNVERGQHANKESEFLLINLAGTCDIKVEDGVNTEVIRLSKAHQGVYLDRMVWKTMYNFSPESILLVASNKKYNPEEYVREYDVFQKLASEI